jgi:hypothetical protein
MEPDLTNRRVKIKPKLQMTKVLMTYKKKKKPKLASDVRVITQYVSG